MDDMPALMPLFTPLMAPGGMDITILLGTFYSDHFPLTRAMNSVFFKTPNILRYYSSGYTEFLAA